MTEHPNKRQGDLELAPHQLQEEKRLVEIEIKLRSLEEKIDHLTTDVQDLVSAWKAAGWLVSAVKYIGALAVAVGAIVTYFKGFK